MDAMLSWMAAGLDFILNLVGLLLWLYWRAWQPARLIKPSPLHLAATLKYGGASRQRRWLVLVALLALLGFRPLVYWHIGSAMAWIPTLHLAVTDLTFRSDYLSRMCLFSGCSFGQTFVVFYLWLFLLSALNRNIGDSDPLQQRVCFHLGWLDRIPAPLKLLAPLMVGAALWAALNPAFTRLGLLPPPHSPAHLGRQALLVGCSSFLAWKALIIAALFLHWLNNYLFLGNLPLWNFLNSTGHNLLRPLRWLPLRLGRLDLSPVVGIVLVIWLSEFGAAELARLFLRLPR